MNYKKMWNTLKAESGYRIAQDDLGLSSISLSELMTNMEGRAKEEEKQKHIPLKMSIENDEALLREINHELLITLDYPILETFFHGSRIQYGSIAEPDSDLDIVVKIPEKYDLRKTEGEGNRLNFKISFGGIILDVLILPDEGKYIESWLRNSIRYNNETRTFDYVSL